MTNANGEVIESSYDGNERVGQTWHNAEGAVQDYLTWVYDEQGNVIAAANDEGTYWMTYDGSRLSTQEGPTGITLTYSYDTAGDVTAIADSSGATTSMTYNAANEVTTKTYSDGTNTLRVDYTYDQAGDVLTETLQRSRRGDELGYTDYGYHGSDLDRGLYGVGGVATLVSDYTYGYDADGRLTSINDGGTVTDDSYDAANELISSGSQTHV